MHASTVNLLLNSEDLAQSVYLHLHAALLGIARSLCSQFYLDGSYAEDLLQDLYIKIHLKEDLFRQGIEAKGLIFLKVVLRHDLIDWSRRRERFKEFTNYSTSSDESSVSLYHTLTEKRLAKFWEALRLQLKNETTFTIMRLFLEGYKHKEIAALMDMPPSTIGVRIHRAKERLKDWKEKPSLFD